MERDAVDAIASDFFADLGREINTINRANGWDIVTHDDWHDNPHAIPSKLALIHSEISEALEGYRKGDMANFTEELGDAIIRIMDVADGLELDLGAEIIRKLAVNRTRGHRHGGKRV